MKNVPTVKKLSVEQAEKILSETPAREVGRWSKVIAEVKKTGTPAQITDLSKGQVAGIVRNAHQAELSARAINKYTGVLITRPVKT